LRRKDRKSDRYFLIYKSQFKKKQSESDKGREKDKKDKEEGRDNWLLIKCSSSSHCIRDIPSSFYCRSSLETPKPIEAPGGAVSTNHHTQICELWTRFF
jgi:hypothetical protein